MSEAGDAAVRYRPDRFERVPWPAVGVFVVVVFLFIIITIVVALVTAIFVIGIVVF